jgi:hypothetical protein
MPVIQFLGIDIGKFGQFVFFRICFVFVAIDLREKINPTHRQKCDSNNHAKICHVVDFINLLKNVLVFCEFFNGFWVFLSRP